MFRMSFKTKKYEVLKQAIPKSLANFIFNYLLIQRGAVDYLVKKNQTNPFNHPTFFLRLFSLNNFLRLVQVQESLSLNQCL